MSKTRRISVKVKKGDIGRALKLFKRKVKESEHLWELKQRKEYLKPAVKRRLIKQKAVRENERLVKEQKKEQGYS